MMKTVSTVKPGIKVAAATQSKKGICKIPNRAGHVSSTAASRRGIPKYSSKYKLPNS